MNRTDEELVEIYLGGEEQALRDLVARYLRVIYHFAYRYTNSKPDAEDIAQEVFIKMWKNLKRYNPEASFRTWLFSVAKHTAIDWLRKKKTVPFSEFDTSESENKLADALADPMPLPSEIAEDASEWKSRTLHLTTVAENLSLGVRTVLRLRYSDDLTFREIAKILGKPLNTIKSQHRRALIYFKRHISRP